MLRDWLVRHLREWLGITAEQTALLARVEALETLTANIQSTGTAVAQEVGGVKRETADLRRILTEKQPKPAVIRARNWSEAVRAMGEEVLQY